MKIFNLIWQIGLLYVIYVIGTFLQKLFHLMIPGSIIGMLILFALLHYEPFQNLVKDGCSFLVKNLALLFIPATVGVMEYFSLFQSKGIWTVFIVIISTVLVMSISSFVSQMTAAKKKQAAGQNGSDQSL
ncbi:CidA/LrgA family protein [Aeribacillus sp. FSL K6-8210]|uniref:CidA/LrgA family protein n=1 Tax=Aeribacillus sp. FSL K6-8210 TaxID=2954683 RepID=UPI0028714A8E|nr:CidA/LrgA family protein [Aeribacillus pallidus]